MVVDPKQVNAIDLSPQQLVSVAAALIPFLEHDDASRALMGANMQRQAVPLIKPEVPVVGTGMESEVARSSGAAIIAERSGVVKYVSADEIVIASDEHYFSDEEPWVDKGIQSYRLKKFNRSSYSTWIHQRPIVRVGDPVCKGDYLTDGTSLTDGELALGANLTVAFMPATDVRGSVHGAIPLDPEWSGPSWHGRPDLRCPIEHPSRRCLWL